MATAPGEYDTKSVLLDLMKSTPSNKICFDCSAPAPQWASISHGTFICLNCSGQHRGLGVHISYVRSLTMDKWNDNQVSKMRLGGNANCKAYFEKSGNYTQSMMIPQIYNERYAAEYRDKLTALVEGREWDPSQTKMPATESAQSGGLRKPRSGISRGSSPSPSTPIEPANPYANKAVVDTNYFSGLGSANAARSDSLRPSEGGKYAGFGSQGSFNPSEATSSRAIPSMQDFQSDPVSALSKGWGLFATTLGQATKTINETVVQPGIAKTQDPALQSTFSSYLSSATTVLSRAGQQGGAALGSAMRSGSEIAKRDLGLDIGDGGASLVEKLSGTRGGAGYAPVGSTPALERQEAGEEQDFFSSHLSREPSNEPATTYGSNSRYSDAPARKTQPRKAKETVDDSWDDWDAKKD